LCIIIGVGVDHDSLVDLAKQHFTKKPIWEESSVDTIDERKDCDLSIAQYTGGKIEVWH